MPGFEPTGERPVDIIEKMKSANKKRDAYKLLNALKDITGKEPVVWYPGIIGFGKYAYKYQTGHSGEAPLIAFAPRDTRFSIYLTPYMEEDVFNQLGKYKRGKGCLYINKLADVNWDVLLGIVRKSIDQTEAKYQISD